MFQNGFHRHTWREIINWFYPNIVNLTFHYSRIRCLISTSCSSSSCMLSTTVVTILAAVSSVLRSPEGLKGRDMLPRTKDIGQWKGVAGACRPPHAKGGCLPLLINRFIYGVSACTHTILGRPCPCPSAAGRKPDYPLNLSCHYSANFSAPSRRTHSELIIIHSYSCSRHIIPGRFTGGYCFCQTKNKDWECVAKQLYFRHEWPLEIADMSCRYSLNFFRQS